MTISEKIKGLAVSRATDEDRLQVLIHLTGELADRINPPEKGAQNPERSNSEELMHENRKLREQLNFCRPQVRMFAGLMESRLRASDHKPSTGALITKMQNDLDALDKGLDYGTMPAKCADIANTAMMISEVARRLQSANDAGELLTYLP